MANRQGTTKLSDDGDDESESFGMRAPIAAMIRHILESYPSGSEFRELLQNADDAAATEVRFILDWRSFGTASLISPELAIVQGPGLIFQNNGPFSEDDWENIRNLGDSEKKKDLAATGQFGFGFRSVFHITDTPVLVANSRMGIIDPLYNKRGGLQRTFEYLNGHALVDQMAPFRELREFGCNFNSPLTPGVLMRFPFRKKPSELSKIVPDREKMREYLQRFQAEAPRFLLFLKYVENVHFLEIDPEGNMREILAVAATLSDECRQQRTLISSFIKRQPKGDHTWLSRLTADLNAEYQLHIAARVGGGEPSVRSWLVRGVLAHGDIAKLAVEGAGNNHKLLPLASVAIPLDGAIPEPARAFCFLETEIETGLPIPVHAFFRLMNQRRALNDAGFPLWNHQLCSLVIAPLYVGALIRVASGIANGTLKLSADQKRSLELFYALWPDVQTLKPWNALVDAFYTRIASHALIDSPAGFILMKDALFHQLECPQVVWDEFTERKAPVALVPARITSHLHSRHPSSVMRVTPNHLLLLLRRTRMPPAPQRVIPLLRYALSKFLDQSSQQNLKKLYDSLNDVPLLPLESGSVALFSMQNNTSPYIFLQHTDDEKQLFVNANRRVISTALPPDVRQILLQGEVHGLNVTNLSEKYLREVIGLCQPAVVTGADPQSAFPPQEWVEQLWKYLEKYWRRATSSVLKDFYLLPTTQREVPFERVGSQRILAPPEVSNPALVGALQLLGCAFISTDYALPFSFMVESGLIHRFSLRGILIALSNAPPSERITPLSPPAAEALRTYAVEKYGDILDAPNRSALVEILLSLAIYPIVASSAFVSLSSEPQPLIPPPDLYDRQLLSMGRFLNITSDEEKVFYVKRLAVRQQDAAGFVSSTLIPALQKPSLDMQSAIAILRYALIHSTKANLQLLKSLPIFPNKAGKLRSIDSLLDPTATDIERLLSPAQAGERLLHPSLADPNCIGVLRAMGLHSSLSAKELSQLIESVLATAESPDSVIERLRQVLLYSSAHSHEIDLKQLPRDIPWIPVLAEAPKGHEWLPWCTRGVTVPLLPPTNVRPRDDMPLCSAIMGIAALSRTDLSARLCDELFDWQQPVPVEVIVQQIRALAHKRDAVMPPVLLEEMGHIYAALQEAITRQKDHTVALLKNELWIWTGFEFVAAHDVAFENPVVGTQQRLRVLPKQFSERFATLFREAGVRNEHPPENFLSMLSAVPQNVPLSAADVEVIVQILRLLKGTKHHPSVALTSNNTLAPIKGLLFVDNLGLQVPAELSGRLLSSRLNEDAQALGVKSLSEHLGAETKIEGEPWGQKLLLCKVLKQITKQYPRESILKEFLQNADDAGATVIHFIYDKRQHPTDYLAGPKLAKLQGPSLVVFNNRSFTRADIENIRNVGNEPKLNDVTKTGVFGLGFNSCYCITDVPSLVTNGTMYFFDPHAGTDKQFLPNATPDQPGRKFPLVGKDTAWLRDHIKAHSFPELGVEPDKPFEGVLFRFPFRFEEKASEVHPRTFTDTDMLNIVDDLMAEASSLPLFLHHVREIRFSVWPNGSDRMQHLLNVSRADTLFPGTSSLFSALELYREKPTDSINMRTARTTAIRVQQQLPTELKSSQTIWLVEEAFLSLPKPLIEKLQKYGVRAVPFGGVALPILPFEPASGSLFYTLPLRLHTRPDVPVHMNAGWLVSSDRRDIERRLDDPEALLWHKFLMEDVLAPAYIRALQLLTVSDWWKAEDIRPLRQYFYRLFPAYKTSNSNDYFQPLRTAFYKKIASAPVMLPLDVSATVTDKSWLSPADPAVAISSSESHSYLLPSLAAVGKRMVVVPEQILLGLSAVIPKERMLSPALLRSLYKQPTAPSAAATLSLEALLHLLQYIIEGLKPTDADQLIGSVVLPTLSVPLQPVVVGRELLLLKESDLTDLGLTGSPLPDVLHPKVLTINYFENEEIQRKLRWRKMEIQDLLALPPLAILSHADGQMLEPTPPLLSWIGNLWKWMQQSGRFPLASHRLLPVRMHQKTVLIQVKHANVSLIYDARQCEEHMLHLLEKLGVPLLESQLAANEWWAQFSQRQKQPCRIQPHPFTPLDLLDVLQSARDLELDWKHVTPDERRLLLTTLCGVPELPKHVSRLQSLPLYETAEGQFIRIAPTTASERYLQPHELPWPLFPETLGRVMFFREVRAASSLYTLLKIEPLQESELLHKHLMPTLHLRHPSEQFEIILRALSSFPLVAEQFRELRFIPQLSVVECNFLGRLPRTVYTEVLRYCGSSVKYLRPIDLASNSSRLLTIAIPIPPLLYCTPEWNQVLVERLRIPDDRQLNDDTKLFKLVCDRVTTLLKTQPNNEHVIRVSAELLVHPALPDSLIPDVSRWRCLPIRNPPLTDLSPLQYPPRASVSELGPSGAAECCWTQLRISDHIPDRFVPYVQKHMTPTTIAQHILEVRAIFSQCLDAMETDRKVLDCLIRCINRSLVMLSQLLEASLSATALAFSVAETNAAVKILSESQFALIWFAPKGTFLPPSMFAFDLHEHLSAYLYCVPPELVPAKTLLVRLGTPETANNVAVYKSVLQKMHRRNRKIEDGIEMQSALSVQDQELCKYLLRLLRKTVHFTEDEDDFAVSDQKHPPLTGVYLPDRQWRLQAAENLVLPDRTDIDLARIPNDLFFFVNDILQDVDFARRLGVRALSERIETLFHASGQVPEGSELSEKAKLWQVMLQSSTFADAVTRLILHHQPQPTMKSAHLAQLHDKLQTMRTTRVKVFAAVVATYRLQPQNEIIATDVPYTAFPYAFDEAENTVFLFTAQLEAITNAVEKILHPHLPTAAMVFIRRLLDMSDIAQLHRSLDADGVRPLPIKQTVDGTLVRKEGDLISDADRETLSEDLTVENLQFEINEMIAWIPDNESEQELAKRHYCYGRIVGIPPDLASLPLLRRKYLVKIAPEKTSEKSVVFLAKFRPGPRTQIVNPELKLAELQQALAAAKELDPEKQEQVLRRIVHEFHPDRSPANPHAQEFGNQLVNALIPAQLSAISPHSKPEQLQEKLNNWVGEARREAYFEQAFHPPPDPRMAHAYASQAVHDFHVARLLFENSAHFQATDKVCFLAQQSVEKMLRAVAFLYGANCPELRSHHLDLMVEIIASALGGEWRTDCAPDSSKLNYYLRSRYPDTLGGQIPYRKWTAAEAHIALEEANRVLNNIKRIFFPMLNN